MRVYACKKCVQKGVETNTKCIRKIQEKQYLTTLPHRIRNDSFKQEKTSELNLCCICVHGKQGKVWGELINQDPTKPDNSKEMRGKGGIR